MRKLALLLLAAATAATAGEPPALPRSAPEAQGDVGFGPTKRPQLVGRPAKGPLTTSGATR